MGKIKQLFCKHIASIGWFECPFVIMICRKCGKRLYSTDCPGAKDQDYDMADKGKLQPRDYHFMCAPKHLKETQDDK